MLRHSPVPEWAETVSAPGANAAGQGFRVSTKCSILSSWLAEEGFLQETPGGHKMLKGKPFAVE